MYLLIRWAINAAVLLILASIIPGLHIASFYVALITILLLGLVNAVIRPVLVLLTLPINVITLGLFTFIINALLFWFVASFVDGFSVTGFWPSFWGSISLTIVSWLVSSGLRGGGRI